MKQVLHWFVDNFYFALHLCFRNFILCRLFLCWQVLIFSWTIWLEVSDLSEMVFLKLSSIRIKQVSVHISLVFTHSLNLRNIDLPVYNKRWLVDNLLICYFWQDIFVSCLSRLFVQFTLLATIKQLLCCCILN